MAKWRLFDVIYEKAEWVIKKMAKPLYERKLKRKFQSAFDECQSQIDNLEVAIHELYTGKEDFDFDINRLIEMRMKVDQAQKVQDFVKAEYETMFWEELS